MKQVDPSVVLGEIYKKRRAIRHCTCDKNKLERELDALMFEIDCANCKRRK